MSSFIRSIHRFFGLPRGRFPSVLRRMALFAMDSSLLLTTWPYHRSRSSFIFSIISATPMVFLTSSFFTWSHRVSPSVHLSIRISITWRVFRHLSLVLHHLFVPVGHRPTLRSIQSSGAAQIKKHVLMNFVWWFGQMHFCCCLSRRGAHIELLDDPECSDEQSRRLTYTSQTPLWRSECTILSTLMLLSHQCHSLSGLPHRRSGCLSQAAGKPVSPVWGSCLHLSHSSHSPSHVWCWSEGSGSECTFEWESWESLHSPLDSSSSAEQRLRSSRTLGCGTWWRGSLMTSAVRWFSAFSVKMNLMITLNVKEMICDHTLY